MPSDGTPVNDGPGDITQLLHHAAEDPLAAEECLSLVYDELRDMARRQMGRQPPGHTLQPTALVHEVYLRIGGEALKDLASREHFFALAARAMGQILVDHARGRKRVKRGGADAKREPLDHIVDAYEERAGDLGRLAEAIDALRRRDESKARLVEMRFFAELSMPQIAEITGAPLRTVERQWALARAWLRNEMDGAAAHD